MVLRQTGNGQYEIYNLGNNSILAAYWLGQVGTDWGFVTLGGFNDGDTSDMLLRNSTSGAFRVYNVAPNDNNITGSASLGTVGLNWQVGGFGNFSSLGETDMILRDSNGGGFQVYDIKVRSSGYVYFMTNPAMPGHVKIGNTRLHPDERARQLSSGTTVARPVKLTFGLYCSAPPIVCSIVLQKFVLLISLRR